MYDEENGFFPSSINIDSQLVNQFGENEIMEILKDMNINFNPHNIFFKYKGFDVSYNSNVSNGLQNGTTISSLGLHDYNTYNIYFVNYTHVGHAYATQGNTSAVFSFHTMSDINRVQVLGHELGHCFNLLHVFNNFNYSECEHVTRDVNSPLYNANVAGDLIHDTPAQDSNPWFTNCVYNFNLNSTDCTGEPYVDVVPANYLGNNAHSTCGFHFTPGQVLRMRTYLQNPSMPHVLQTFNTIESLYEPFEIDYIPSNEIVSVETSELGEGFALVCRINTMKHRFQKSFDYLVDPDEKSINPINYSINELPEIAEIGNYKLTIFQVDHEITKPLNLYSRCVVCNDEPYVGGNIISTEFMGSYNFTQQTLNQIQVSDPNLLQNLESEKYHIIKKETESGAIKQTTIYKY